MTVRYEIEKGLTAVYGSPDNRKKIFRPMTYEPKFAGYFKHILTSHVSVRERSGAGSSAISECGWRVATKKLAFLTAFA